MQKRARTDVYTRARGEVFCSLLSRPDVYKTCFFFVRKMRRRRRRRRERENKFFKGERERDPSFLGEKNCPNNYTIIKEEEQDRRVERKRHTESEREIGGKRERGRGRSPFFL